MDRNVEVAFLLVVEGDDGFQVLALRLAGVVVKDHHLDAHAAELVGDVLDHAAGLVDLVEHAGQRRAP